MGRSRSGAGTLPVSKLLKMRSLGTVGVAAALAFYVAWPLYAGYEIRNSLDGHNVETLNARVDFPSVRTSLRPAVAAKVDKVVDDALRKAGTAGSALAEKLKQSVTPRIVDGVLATLVTPEMMIRIHASGKTLKEALESLVLERAGQAEGFGGFLVVPQDQQGGQPSKLDEIASSYGIDLKKVVGAAGAKEGVAQAEAPQSVLPALNEMRAGPKYGLGNIKHFSLAGPFGLTIGVSRDANARKPELTADLTFVDGTWKLTGLVPES
ncbi:DUF2939 domain-containing protein [Hyphomicrobium sp.]|uniref:DUF2939 domain-containing protein n=1 Tax=Hyphomicrobium sp. TaxID=82 RepID=UPI002E35F302|nr:DUF2939 domain-containing protein [Hyphomicrobium sp.]HEX2841502.1 DUF2939 domain-containing protein [Hyphomicrobium sp.]